MIIISVAHYLNWLLTIQESGGTMRSLLFSILCHENGCKQSFILGETSCFCAGYEFMAQEGDGQLVLFWWIT